MRIHKFTHIIDMDKDNTFNRDGEGYMSMFSWGRRDEHHCDHEDGRGPLGGCDIDDCRLRREELLDANPFTRPWPTLGIPLKAQVHRAAYVEVVYDPITRDTILRFDDGKVGRIPFTFGGVYGKPDSSEAIDHAYRNRRSPSRPY